MSAFEFSHLLPPEGAEFPHHRHARPHLIMVFRGGWTDRGDAGTVRLGAGDVLFHPACAVHSTRVDAPDTEVVVLRVGPEIVNEFCPLYGNVARDVHCRFESLRGIPDRIREELLDRDDAAPFILDSLAMQLLALGSRAEGPRGVEPPSWFPAVLDFVHRSFAGRPTAKAAAMRIGVSASRVAHVFREVMGRSITDYVRECRVRAAAKALRETNAAIGEIAIAAGFYDQAHLTRAFRALQGMTPLEYRRSQQRVNRDRAS